MQMKKFKLERQHYIIGGVIAGLLILLVGIMIFKPRSMDAAKFKEEYEKLNGEKSSTGQTYQKLSIDKDNKVKYGTLEDAVALLAEGTGVVYFGAPDCPWCRSIVPSLLKKIDCSCLENVLYVDMTGKRNTYEVKDNKPVETEQADQDYYRLLELLDEHLENYSIKDDDGVEHVVPEKRIYLPLVVGVRNGKVVSAHTGSVELGDTQSPFDDLSDVQRSELEVIFENLIKEVVENNDTTCDNHC